MACEEDNYGLDAYGNRILIGLTQDETREFGCLDGPISNSVSPFPTSDVRLVSERRWLVLYEKHETALCDRLERNLAAAAGIRRRLLDALLAEAVAPADDRELEAAE